MIIRQGMLMLAAVALLGLSACDSKQPETVQVEGIEVVEVKSVYNPPVANNISSLRPNTAIDEERMPPPMATINDSPTRKARAYPMQAPTIPHRIEGYQLDAKANQCMSCHSRSRVAESGAIMVSVTHFMNRDGQFLAEISPRRYFCTQCHVVQTNAPSLVTNDFVDMQAMSQPASDEGEG